eukprot:scaffold296_cov102-Amphora_coffeaeformis.AAC.16
MNSKKQFDIEGGLVLETKATREKATLGESSALGEEEAPSVGSSGRHERFNRILIIVTFIVVLGCTASCAFLTVGITSAVRDQQEQFKRSATDLVAKIESAWEDYVHAASIIHGRCRGRDFTRSDFRDLYEYITADGLDFQAAQFDPNISHADRDYYEEEARQFYAENYPHINYTGFRGFNTDESESLEPRWNDSFYFPIHYMEPIIGNEAAIDLDYHASGARKRTVMFCINNGRPALTDRLRLVQEREAVAYGVVLMHPGVNLTNNQGPWPRDLASIVVRIPALLERSASTQGESARVYLYDKSDSSIDKPVFLAGANVLKREGDGRATITHLEETGIHTLHGQSRHIYVKDISAANKIWTVVILSVDGTFEPDLVFVILGGTIIGVASMCLAWWIWTNNQRMIRFNRMKSQVDAEKAALILESAKETAKAERELNDFIAHEVRNPVAAAMSATSFVKTAIAGPNPLKTEEELTSVRDDVAIIDNALRFVNDLLRQLLDMHRASNKQLKVNKTPTDILHDILEPVEGMLHQRGGSFDVTIKCEPRELFVLTDRLRLNQIILNLGRNSSKFVDKGFVRLTAGIDEKGHVFLAVEDSGPGIPKEKRDFLFAKFQESLDSLNQGTGIGLFLCKNLAELLGGDLRLDPDFNSGFEGNPGTRFVVSLRTEPIEHDDYRAATVETGETSETAVLLDESSRGSLPEQLNVLFVDDDPILRKLFSRTIRTVAPGWSIREAANGETALRLIENQHFDLIFMDMYLASVEKQMLGTETVKALRLKGIDCRICGLSANDKEVEFLEAGADVFVFKPIPCDPIALTHELRRILYLNSHSEARDARASD